MAHLQKKSILLALVSCCSFCSYFNHVASTVAVFVHFAAFLCASPLRQPHIEILQKHTCLEPERGKETDRGQKSTLLISVPTSDDRKHEASAVKLKPPILGATWVFSGDGRQYSSPRLAGATGHLAEKGWQSSSKHFALPWLCTHSVLGESSMAQASFNRISHALASHMESGETCFQVPLRCDQSGISLPICLMDYISAYF